MLPRQKVAPDDPCSPADTGLCSDTDQLLSASLSVTHFPKPVRFSHLFISPYVFICLTVTEVNV